MAEIIRPKIRTKWKSDFVAEKRPSRPTQKDWNNSIILYDGDNDDDYIMCVFRLRINNNFDWISLELLLLIVSVSTIIIETQYLHCVASQFSEISYELMSDERPHEIFILLLARGTTSSAQTARILFWNNEILMKRLMKHLAHILCIVVLVTGQSNSNGRAHHAANTRPESNRCCIVLVVWNAFYCPSGNSDGGIKVSTFGTFGNND